MSGKPYQSILIPYEEDILTLRRQRPPVAFSQIAELLREKYQVSIQRAAICKFVNVRARWKRRETRETSAAFRTLSRSVASGSRLHNSPPQLRNDVVPPNSQGIEHRRPWPGWQKENPASTGRMLTTFTPRNEYNLTRLTPEEAAAYVEQLKREREKNGG